MVVTRRVPSPRSVRHLLQVALVLANIVGKRVLYVKHGRSASSRTRHRQTRRELAGEVQLCCERRGRIPSELSQRTAGGRRPEAFLPQFVLAAGVYQWLTRKPPPTF